MKKLSIVALVVAVLAIILTIEAPEDPEVYAELTNYTSGGYTFPIAATGKYYNVTHLRASHLEGFQYKAGRLTALYDGHYLINYGMTFTGGNANLYGFGIAYNGVISSSRGCYAKRTTSSAAVGNSGTTCILEMNKGDFIMFQLEDEGAPPKDAEIIALTITIERQGDLIT